MSVDRGIEIFADIPGTRMFDALAASRGYWLNAFCQSLMQPGNRERFKADERAFLDEWPLTEEQKQAVLDRDLNRCIDLGGNVFFLVKIGATDGASVQKVVGSMSGLSADEYHAMMVAGGRSPVGVRSIAHPER